MPQLWLPQNYAIGSIFLNSSLEQVTESKDSRQGVHSLALLFLYKNIVY